MRLALVLHVNGRDPASLQLALATMTALNELYLSQNQGVPRLYRSGVVYATEPNEHASVASSEERIASIPEVLRLGWGDCDDLACYLSAERRVFDGIRCEPRVVLEAVRPDGSHFWHVVVAHPDGSMEDPSLALGMNPDGESLAGIYPEESELR